jgi:hypothetical protein
LFVVFSVKDCFFVINGHLMLRTEWIPRPQAEDVIACLHLLG